MCAPSSQRSAPRAGGFLGQGSLGQALEAAGPDGGGDAARHGGLVDARIAEGVQGGDGQARIGDLMGAEEAGPGQIQQPLAQGHRHPAMGLVGVKVAAHGDERRLQGVRLTLDDLHRLRPLARDDDRTAVLDDPGLLPGDLAEIGAEQLQVIEVHRGDHRDRRRGEDIGGVVAAAQAHLDHAKVGGVFGEGVKGEGDGDLEEADGLAGVGRLNLGGQAR